MQCRRRSCSTRDLSLNHLHPPHGQAGNGWERGSEAGLASAAPAAALQGEESNFRGVLHPVSGETGS